MPQDLISQFDRKYALPIETYRQVLNLSLRNAIPNGIRWEGMMCYVVSEGKSYVLTGGLTDSDWVEFGTLVNVNVVDNLLSTSATDALSANQGRVLQNTKLSDAPSDGNTYGRLDGAWAVVGGGAVDSVFGRTGDVVAQTGDYTFAQIGSTPTTLSGYGITDAVPTSRTLTAGDGLSGGGTLAADRSFAVDNTVIRTTGDQTKSGTLKFDTFAGWQLGTGTPTIASFSNGTNNFFDLTGNLTIRDGSSPRWTFERTTGNFTATGTITGSNLSGTNTGDQTLSGLGGVPTSRTLTAGNGLTGGGDLSANRTFTLGTPGSTTLSSTNAVTASSHTHAFAPGGTTAQYIRGDGSLATYAGGVTSVFGRTGAVVAANGDYTFAQIGSKPTTISGYGITDFNSLGDARWLGISAKAADSNLLDGIDNTSFLRSDSNTVKTSGHLTFNNNLQVQLGTAFTFRAFSNGTNNFFDIMSGNLFLRDNTTNRFTFERTTGDLTATGTATATNFILSSDRRLKKNIKNYDPKPLDLKYRTWEWKKDGRPGMGYIAQEVQKTNPEYVVEGSDGMLAVDYIGILVAKVAELESDIAKIKKQI